MFCMAVCLWNGGEMKKGQIRTGVVRNVKFPNRAMVVLEPLEGAADDEEICEVKGDCRDRRFLSL